MQRESVCLKVPKQEGEKALILAKKLGIIDSEREIQRNTDSIYVPLLSRPSEDKMKTLKKQIADCEISTHAFSERKKHKASLADLLADILPPHLLASLPHAVDFVGNIAIIEIPPELDSYKKNIGEAILNANQNLRTVLAKAGSINGTFRLREFTVIAGEPKTETVHKEYGCQYYVDIAKAYFSPRLSNEHNRIASSVSDGEIVVDMFTGVGPFAIQIAKAHANVKVYAVDLNPYAIEYLRKNVRLSRVESRVYPILGDARRVVHERLLDVADRVIMNLPEKALEFIDVACEALKPTGGVVHFYSFINASDPIENLQRHFTEEVEKNGRRVKKIKVKFVRATAPYEWQVVLDAEIH
jgi:tRNA (guanine37-N1)-methyltransferase